MDLSPLSNDKIANLKHLGESGDMMAEALTASTMAKLYAGGTPAAASTTALHAAVFGDATGPVTVAVSTNPDVPRNVEAAFGATYDGGNVTVNGLDQYGNPVSETLTVSQGATVAGTKIFASVSSMTYAGGGVGTHSTNTVSLGVGTKIGLHQKPATGSPVICLCDGAGVSVTFDATLNAFTPATAPNGSHVYVLLFNV